MSTCSSACFMTKWSPSSELEQALKEHGRFTIVQSHIPVDDKESGVAPENQGEQGDEQKRNANEEDCELSERRAVGSRLL
mmetsp:Transcript_27615/g.89968  ORF Transcript_27615/g.89968 Transcript_27615/m.89968 type:complete len:80 (-) Transcript_27615:1100-1339(-)